MRPAAVLLALAALGAGHPLALEPVEGAAPVSTDVLDDIYTFAAFTRAAYCAANNDGVVGNPVCASAANASAPACALFAGAVTAAEFSDRDEVAGNVVVDHARRLVVVSFRGSHSLEDVWRNLQVALVDAPLLCANCSVHEGYWTSFLHFRPRLDAALSTDTAAAVDGYRVVLTGHSMGGALAAISAAYLRSRGRACDVFTYGAPRVGNQALVDVMADAAAGVTAHVTNRLDIVVSQPPLSMGYAAAVPEYWFEAGIDKAAFPDNLRVCDGAATPADECSPRKEGWLWALADGLLDHTIDAYSNGSMPCP